MLRWIALCVLTLMPGLAIAGPDDILVRFRGGPPTDLTGRARPIQRFAEIGAELWRVDGDRLELLERLRRHPLIEYAEPDVPVYLEDIPNDPRFGEQWGFHNTGQSGGLADADIDAPEAWDMFTGSDVVVAVIDTGAELTHPDLAANIWTNPGEVAGNGIDDDANGYVDDIHGWDFFYNTAAVQDTFGHGTHTAGTVGAITGNGIGVAGTCPQVRLMILKGFNGQGAGYTSGLVNCLLYSARMGAKISSNSWVAQTGQPVIQSLYDAITFCENAGQLVVFAAANSGMDVDCARTCPGVTLPHPMIYPHAALLTVAATDRNDRLASFSNYGVVSCDLAAPGVSVLSTYPTFKGTGGGYQTFSGTSMACPHVAGAAALVLGRNPTLTSAQLKFVLMSATDPLPALSGKCVTGGRLNIGNVWASPLAVGDHSDDDEVPVPPVRRQSFDIQGRAMPAGPSGIYLQAAGRDSVRKIVRIK